MINPLLFTPALVAALAAQAEGEAAAASPWSGFWMMGVIILIFWFLIIAPQRKEAKEKEQMRDSLKKGDEVVTIGGLRGQVTGVAKQTVELRISPRVEATFERSAIIRMLRKAEATEAAELKK